MRAVFDQMCGLAGILGGDGAIADAVGRMAGAMHHRGPDDDGEFVEGSVRLVHKRLAIVDLSAAGHQPIFDASGRYVMVYNGEIYNHLELRDRFLPLHSFRGTSDSETLVELFAKRGVAALSDLNGIFAAAIWDRRDRQLTLFRDGAGVKPLYIWERPGGGIAFASELKAIAALPGFSSRLDPVAAAAYVTYLWSPGQRTMFSDVRKFPAGCWQIYDADGESRENGRFYSLPSYDPCVRDDARAIEETHDALAAAVKRQMLADVEVGAFLSGGLDSTAVVHFARKHSGDKPMQCFTLAYEGGEGSELAADLPYARRAAAHLGVQLHEISISPGDLRDLPELVQILDEPQADPAAMGNLVIAKAAQNRGIKVLLGGAGGDDIFSGYRRHMQFAHDRWVGVIPSGLRRFAFDALRATGGAGRYRRVDRLLSGAQGSGDERILRAFEWLERERSASLVAGGVSPEDLAAPMAEALRSTVNEPSLERLLRLDQEFFLRDHNLNYVDKTGMAASVEIRVPFLDTDLMAFAASLPVRQKLRGRNAKWVFKKAMEPHLPMDLIYRPKTGFGVPLREWMDGPLRDQVFDLTDQRTVAQRGLFSATEVNRLRNDHYAGRIDAAYPLLGVMMVELWCRRFA